MMRFKPCPKCQGTLSLQKDADGRYLRCWQCGLHMEFVGASSQLRVPHPVGASPAEGKREYKKRGSAYDA